MIFGTIFDDEQRQDNCCMPYMTVLGQGTGETLYRTPDGRMWRRLDSLVDAMATSTLRRETVSSERQALPEAVAMNAVERTTK